MKNHDCTSPQASKKLKSTQAFLKLIAEENRIRILCMLKSGPKCVCKIWPALKITQNLSSHHLKVLKEAGLLKARKQGLNVFYEINQVKLNQELNKLNLFLKKNTMMIKILGSGCSNCLKLENNTKEAIAQLNMAANIEKVTDIAAIMAYGIMSTPALVLDEKVLASGRVLEIAEIKELLSNQNSSETKNCCDQSCNCEHEDNCDCDDHCDCNHHCC